MGKSKDEYDFHKGLLSYLELIDSGVVPKNSRCLNELKKHLFGSFNKPLCKVQETYPYFGYVKLLYAIFKPNNNDFNEDDNLFLKVAKKVVKEPSCSAAIFSSVLFLEQCEMLGKLIKLTEHEVKVLESVLDSLDEKQKFVIVNYFGIPHGSGALSLKDIGQKLGIGRERVRQIKQKAIRMLKLPVRSKRLEVIFHQNYKEQFFALKIDNDNLKSSVSGLKSSLMDAKTELDIRKDAGLLIEENKNLLYLLNVLQSEKSKEINYTLSLLQTLLRQISESSDLTKALERLHDHKKNLFLKVQSLMAENTTTSKKESNFPSSSILEESIEILQLSVRSYNCLHNCCILTIGELIDTTERKLLKTKNFGKTCLAEIHKKLEPFGLKLNP